MTQHILLIGATGFTGKRVLEELKSQGIQTTCLVRNESVSKLPDGADYVTGNLDDTNSLATAMKDKDGLIFLASMGFGQMDNVIEACQQVGLKRAVFTSSTAIFTQLNAQSKDGREAGESTVKESGLDWTILRPTMIYGRKGDRNMERLVRYLKKFPALVIPGNGKALQQPVFVDDVAKAAVAAYQSEKAIRKAYNISGAEPLTFNEVVKTTAAAMGKKMLLIHIPLFLPVLILKAVEKVIKNPRIKSEQLLRLNENKNFDHSEAKQDFGFAPRPFDDGIQNLTKEIR